MAISTLRTLTQSQVDQFMHNGFLVVDDLLDADEIAVLAERADLIASGKAEHIVKGTVQLEQPFREGETKVENRVMATRKLAHIVPEDEVLRAHARNSKIVDVIADLMGTDDITLYGDQLFMKPPRHGSAKEWHQDSASFKNIFPMNLISAWAAIDNVTIENGCLWMVPGSQRWAVIPPSSRPTIEGQFGEEYPTVPVPLRAGSVSFHHSLTYHASGPNETDTRRRGYATHYMRSTSFKDQAIEGSPAVTRYTHIRGQSYPGTVSEDVLEA
jgi:phytanoyl-CoA hydroxylase